MANAVEQLVPELGIEALAVAVLPWTARLDVAVFAPMAAIHSLTVVAMNSGPLSDRMWAGTPRKMNRSDRTSMTSVDRSFRSTRMTRHSRVNSSIRFNIRNFLPSWSGSRRSRRTRHVWILWPQTDAGPVTQPEPTFLRLLLRTLSPSCRQIRSTRFTFHRPASFPKERREPAVSRSAHIPRRAR